MSSKETKGHKAANGAASKVGEMRSGKLTCYGESLETVTWIEGEVKNGVNRAA
jgi:hypothetical protein